MFGHDLFYKIRVQNNNIKTFYFEHKDSNGNITKGQGDQKVLYQLPQLLNGIENNQPIFLVEGEKDANTLISLGLIFAKRGVGKTHIALGIAYAVASGSTFLSWVAPQAHRVLYIDGEMPACLIQERLKMIEAMNNVKPQPTYLQILTPDLQKQPMPDLSYKEERNSVEPFLEPADLIIIDNISCLFRTGSENESESWKEAQEWSLDLRRRGKSVLLIHHAGKSGQQRGTSKKEDILDSVITLRHPDDYKTEQGARFDVIFDKVRHFSGEDAQSFQAYLNTKHEKPVWEVSNSPKDEEIRIIAELKNSGSTIKQIGKELNRTKAQIEWRLKKAKKKGLLT